MNKKLYRSVTDRKLSGVCGGLAEYLNMDVTLIRLLWALISFFTGGFPGLIVYIVFALIVPEPPANNNNGANQQQQNPYNGYYNNNQQ